jgi:phosphoribosylformimino-5-aminoimidazole carboxamide ribonucleotide (ProFAR) isomerase
MAKAVRRKVCKPKSKTRSKRLPVSPRKSRGISIVKFLSRKISEALNVAERVADKLPAIESWVETTSLELIALGERLKKVETKETVAKVATEEKAEVTTTA